MERQHVVSPILARPSVFARLTAVAAILAGPIVSCSVPPVLTANGPARTDGAVPSQFSRFRTFYIAAAAVPPPVDEQAANARLLRAGLSLVANNCDDFFRAEGRRQQRLAFSRDTSTVLATIAVGALGVARVAGSAVAVVALSTAGSNATIDIIAQNFLFGADNIDDVRQLVVNAIAAHANAVMALQEGDPAVADFDWTVRQIEDNQEICQGPRILALARSAIALGNIKAYTTAVDGAPRAAFTAVKASLARAAGVAALTDDQAGALFAVVRGSAVAGSVVPGRAALQDVLAGLKAQSPFEANGLRRRNWPEQDAVRAVFDRADAATQQLLARLATEISRANSRARAFMINPLSPAGVEAERLPQRVGVRVQN